MFQGVEKLIVYEKSYEWVLSIYEVTSEFPREELFGLTSQIRRSAASISANIAEGRARESDKEYKRFLYISRGSLEETKFHLNLSKDLGYIDSEIHTELIYDANKIGRLLNGLINSLKDE
jgi:four helix bundle protein